MTSLRLAGATLNQIPFDWKNNIQNIIEAIDAAKNAGVKILCLPELCITGYGCEDTFLSEWLSEEALKRLQIIAGYCDNIIVTAGLPIKVNQATYNGVAVISNKKILGITLKQNLALDGVHYEPRWFKAWRYNDVTTIPVGDDTVSVGDLIYDTEGIKFGFEICEDAWRKRKRPGYRLHERNVDLILNPSASHFAMGKSLLREKEVVIDGSSLFQCAYVFVNHLGNEAGRMIYDGDIIIAQNGKLLAVNKRLSFRNYNLLATDVNFSDPSQSVFVRSDDNKEKNEELSRAVSLGLFDYLRKSRSKGFVLSLSGGADSSSCAVMVAEMVRRASAELGWSKFCSMLSLDDKEISEDWRKAVNKLLTCAYQGTRNSSGQTFAAAKNLADSIGARFYHWIIDDEVNSYSAKIEKAIGRKLSWDSDDVTMQNIQARSRSPVIWMLANINRAVLLTTSNRSEGDVGYATMDGDTSGSLAPIAGLSKPFIIQWLRWAEAQLGHAGLRDVNRLQPTAELRPADKKQTDEDDLMPYVVLEEIERNAILERRSPLEVFNRMKDHHEPDILKIHIRKFFRLWSINQWKRERLAPSFHLDELNVDPRSWCRFPILSSGFEEELERMEKA